MKNLLVGSLGALILFSSLSAQASCFNYYEKKLANNQDRKMALTATGFLTAIGGLAFPPLFLPGTALLMGGGATILSNKHYLEKPFSSNPAPLKKLLLIGSATEPDSVSSVKAKARFGVGDDSDSVVVIGRDGLKLESRPSEDLTNIQFELSVDAKEAMLDKFVSRVRKLSNSSVSKEEVRESLAKLDKDSALCEKNINLRKMAKLVVKDLDLNQ